MKLTYQYMIILTALISTSHLTAKITTKNQHKYIGLFRSNDQRLEGIRWGNWGSRPFEYAWVAQVVNVQGKKVIDLGVGLPSQYNWYEYVVNNLKPSYYVGIDYDGRIKNEVISQPHYEIRHMSMANIEYPDKFFDIAYCISTFEHIPYEIFMKSIQETHRVLKDDGLLIITLDEEWDKNQSTCYDNGWNTLELSLMEKKLFHNSHRSFGLPEFLNLIKDYFVLMQEDAVINDGIIHSKNSSNIYYSRLNRDHSIINSGLPVNSCVSYAVLKKYKTNL